MTTDVFRAWALEDRFTLTETEGDTVFQGDIALDGDMALIGANLDDVRGTDSGAAYLYRFDGATWRYDRMLQGEPTLSCGSNFGRLVDLHDGNALVRQGRATYFFELAR